MQHSAKWLLVFCVAFTCACGEGNQKSDALSHYEEIYKIATGVRIGERHLIADLNEYADSIIASDSSYLNQEKLGRLQDSLKAQNTRLEAAIKAINALPAFDYAVDLRDKSTDVLEAELNFNRVNVNQALLVFSDGIVEETEKNTISNFQTAYSNLKSTYREWKDIRNAYCNTFGIEYDDVKPLENKYVPEAEQR